MTESYTFKNQKKLRRGYTTGTCAAAAGLAAAKMLFGEERQESLFLMTPKGIEVEIPVEEAEGEAGKWYSCCVRKDAGDDPDVTDQIKIYTKIWTDSFENHLQNSYNDWYRQGRLFLRGGKGVGTVTRAGLSCPVGKAAINPVPRKMIFDLVGEAAKAGGYEGPLYIEVSVPEGEERAGKTFNPHLGIVGGISILGTSGIVEPMSEEALIETIGLEIRQKAAEGRKLLVAAPGNYGEAFLKDELKLDIKHAVKCSNYIGETIDAAVCSGFSGLIFVGHGGKLIKLAAGIMNTHSSYADGRGEILAAYGGLCGASREGIEKLLSAITVEEGLGILEQEGILAETMETIMKRILFHLKKRAAREDFFIGACVFTNERGILGMTEGTAERLAGLTGKSIER